MGTKYIFEWKPPSYGHANLIQIRDLKIWSWLDSNKGIEEADDDIMTSEELSELTFSTHPNR